MRLFPHRVGIQFRERLAALDVLVQDRRHIRFRHFGVPGCVRIDDDSWSLLAGAEAGGAADEDLTRSYALLHETDVKGHEEGSCSGAAARGLRVAWRTSVGADDDVILRFRHGFFFDGYFIAGRTTSMSQWPLLVVSNA